MKREKVFKTLFIMLFFVFALVLTGCEFSIIELDDDDETIDVGCQHEYKLLNKVDAVDCQTPGYADYECELCGKHKHERLIIQHDCEDLTDYISLQYCKTCKQNVRLNSLGTIDEDFYYCYKESMKADFEASIEDCYASLKLATETMTQKEKEDLAEEVNAKYSVMIDEFYKIKDQYSIAEINFYTDKNDDTEEKYDFIKEVYNEYSEKYRALYYDMFHSPLQEILFEGEDLEKIEKQIANYKDENITKLENEIDQMTDDLYFNESISDINFAKEYANILAKRNELAKLYNYDNYYEYAHSVLYGREYSVDQVEQFREYCAEYLPSLVTKYYTQFYYATEKRSAYSALLAVCDTPMFDSASSTKLYVNYLKSMSDSTLNFYEKVNNAYKDGRVYVSTSDGVEAAFTTSILGDSTNIMFFYNGDYYASPMTVVHETGHFMFSDYYNYNDFDLFEVQSQTNEKMFCLYLNKKTSTNTDCILPYSLLSEYDTILNVCAVDEFEYALYTNYSDLASIYKDGIDYTEYDSLFTAICNKYGIEAQNSQWHYYTTQSSVYEISYGISLIPTIAKYYEGLENYDSAKRDYFKLLSFPSILEATKDNMEADTVTLTFLEALEYANFKNPFEEDTFKNYIK